MKTALGKADAVVFMNDATYPYEGTGLPVVKIGIAFSKETRTVSEWKTEN